MKWGDFADWWKAFARSVRYDLRRGFRYVAISAACLTPVILFMLHLVFRDAMLMGYDREALTFGDAMFVIFAGKRVPEPRPGLVPIPPLGWTLLIMLIVWTSLAYPSSDLRAYRYQSLTRCGSRSAWFASKALWIVGATFAVWVVVWLVGVCVAYPLGLNLSLDVTHMGLAVAGGESDYGHGVMAEPSVWCVPIIVLVSLALLQFACGIHGSPTLAFMAPMLCSLFAIGVSSATLVISFILFSRCDLVSKEGSR